MNKDFFNFLSSTCNINFNDKQKSAIIQKTDPILVLASPGSGKTTVLNAHIAYLIFKYKIHPKNILALTFSKAAAKDMDDRFYKTYGKLIPSGVKFSTIHSFSYRIIRSYYRQNNIPYDLVEGMKNQYNKNIILKNINKQINNTRINDDKLEELSNAISFVKNLMIHPKDFDSYNFQIKNFDQIFKTYENYKKNNEYRLRLLDFDDMLIEANNILENNPYILKLYQKQYEYVLMDEGQDTSLIQNKIVEKIAFPQNNLFVVCDDDQSIFGFRGADPKYLLDFKSRYKKGSVIFMEQNYRSSKNIVDVSNLLIRNNTKRYAKNMFTDNHSHKPINIVKLDSDTDQYRYLVNEIKKNNDLSDIAILYRNNMSTINLVDELYTENISFYMKDYHKHFFNHWVLNDLLNFVRFSYDTTNVHSLESIYTKFNSYISRKEIEYLKGADLSKSVFDNLIHMPDVKDFRKRNLQKFKKSFDRLKDLSPFDTIHFIRYDLKYEERLDSYCKITGYSMDNIINVLSTLENLSKGLSTMDAFVDKLNNLKLAMDNSKFNKNKNAITLSTLHSSKGLEFEKVYMIDLIDGQIPNSESIKSYDDGDIYGLEEERRLWYVGMTRAKKNLDLITTNYKNNEYVHQSRFITELMEIMSPTTEIRSIKKNKSQNKPFTIINTNAADTSHLSKNVKVNHKAFGKGTIKSIDEDILIVDFGKLGLKQLSAQMCVSKNLLIRI